MSATIKTYRFHLRLFVFRAGIGVKLIGLRAGSLGLSEHDILSLSRVHATVGIASGVNSALLSDSDQCQYWSRDRHRRCASRT